MTGHSEEVEKLARTLRTSRVVQSESEAYRMANEMLNTSKKVNEDFKKRDELYHGTQSKNAEVEKAHFIMEKLTENMAKGKPNVRIDVGELDLNKPLKELMPAQPSQHELIEDEDDAILINSPELTESKAFSELAGEPVIVESQAPSKEEAKSGDNDDDFFGGDDDGSEEEKASEEEFSVKEL